MTVEHVQQIDRLWKEWGERKEDAIGNQLIEYYMYLVHYHVERVASYIPETFSKSDLKSLGLMGLYDALQKFDPDRKLKFATYATVRNHGSLMDRLRKEDWLPITLREQSIQVHKLSHSLEQTLSRKPSPNDITLELTLTIYDVDTLIAHTLFANLLSTD